jgi:citrate synthase
VDPRLAPIKEALIELNVESDPLLRVAREIDRLSSIDDYFLSRGLHANADFYTPFSYVAM